MNTQNLRPCFQRILFCTDFSENAAAAFAAAMEQALRANKPDLHLLHVIPEPGAQFWKSYIQDLENAEQKAHADIEAKIRTDYRSRLPQGFPMTVALRNGSADQAILAYAEEIRAELLVIGRQGRSAMGKVWFGNVTEKVVRKVRCAVLVVPNSRHY